MAGVEWWAQEQWGDDEPKELHTDKDVEATPDGAFVSRHPLCSSVLYLGPTPAEAAATAGAPSGGPTVVFGQAKRGALGALEPPRPRRVALAFPRANHLLLFGGAPRPPSPPVVRATTRRPRFARLRKRRPFHPQASCCIASATRRPASERRPPTPARAAPSS